jgi:hypothetical protein
MSTDEPIVTAIDHYLSHHQIREDIVDLPDEGIDWEKRFWNTKDKLLRLQRDCKEIDQNLVSWGEVNTLDDIIITIGVYEMSSLYFTNNPIHPVWTMRRHKDPMIPPIIGQQWYKYLGEPFPNGALGKVVVLLSEEGVLFANEIARRIYDERLRNYRR